MIFMDRNVGLYDTKFPERENYHNFYMLYLVDKIVSTMMSDNDTNL